MVGLSQALPQGIGPPSSPKGFAKALRFGSQGEATHTPVCLEERATQQRHRAQRSARRNAQTADWHGPRRASSHAREGSGSSAPLAGFLVLADSWKSQNLIVIPSKRSLRGEGSGRAARSVAFGATQ